MKATQSIGIGCASKATVTDVVALIKAVIPAIAPDTILATLDRRAALARSVAESLGLELLLFSAEALAKVDGTATFSAASLQHTGSRSIAEAAALAALGTRAHLVVTRRSGNLCTCAVATACLTESL